MPALVKRPDAPLGTAPGFLRRDQFQTAYVTTDLDRACDLLGSRYGISSFSFIEGEMQGGGELRVAFAWVGGNMYEIIDARGPGAVFYTNRLPADGFAMAFHHLGFLVHGQEGWDALRAEIAASATPIVFSTEVPDLLDAVYIEAPELGHYLEYILPRPGGVAFFESIPAN